MRNPLPALAAFSRDAAAVSSVDREEQPLLGHWLAVAQAAERLSSMPAVHRAGYLTSVETNLLPPLSVRPTLVHDAQDGPVDPMAVTAERLRVEAEAMERAGCFELAFTTVAAVCRLTAGTDVVTRMVATAHLGRIARQLGDLHTASDCYESVVREGSRKRDGPLESLGLLGLGALARMRGNRPDERLLYGRALKRAHPGGITERSAHQGLMNAAISETRLADALLHGWRAYDLSPEGSDERAMLLSNLALTALTAGFPDAALNGFLHVLTVTSVVRVRLPAYGGAVRAAARLGDRPRVEALESSAIEETSRANTTFEVASFFLSAADAWNVLHDTANALQRLRRTEALIESRPFHELSMKVDELRDALQKATPPAVPAPSAWTDDSTQYGDKALITGIRRLTRLSR